VLDGVQDAVLSAQNPKSLSQGGKMAHDEMLFIIIHQVRIEICLITLQPTTL